MVMFLFTLAEAIEAKSLLAPAMRFVVCWNSP